MEGASGGIVAIVQGLRDAGLAVTLMGGRRARDTLPAPHQTVQVSLGTHAGTAEAGTSAAPATSVDIAAQICDDRYTSSYQLAHCHVRPSSPLVEISEFPPQRPEPCRTQGNFEIGAGSGEMKAPAQTPVSQSPPHTLRNSFTSVDRGVLSPSPSSRCAEAFAHSLRKYPGASPPRGISSELVQRLLSYTQAKNFSKSSYHSKSLRSLRNRKNSPTEIVPGTESTKCVQTHTKTKAKESAPIQEGEGQENKEENKIKKRPQSPVRSPRDVRYKDNHINTTYDYLKSTSPRRFSGRGADVRYLTEMTRSLRNVLREICDSRPVACPNIQSRYSRHRREHHAPGNRTSADSNETAPRASLPVVSTEVPAMSSSEALQGTHQQTSPTRPKICCYCRRPLPCACAPRASVHVQRFRIDSSIETDRQEATSQRHPSEDFDDQFVTCPHIQRRYSRHRREHHATDSNETSPRASLPVVSTGVPAMSSCEAVQGTYQRTCPTRPKICCYCRRPLPCACAPRSSVHFQRSSIESNDYARSRSMSKDVSGGMSIEDFAKNLKEQVFNWLQEVPVYANDTPEDRSLRQDMATQLVDKLKVLKDDEDFEDKAKVIIAECVSDMPMWCPGNKEDQELFKEQIADNLLNKILNISKNLDKFESEISKWVESLNLKSTDSQGQVIDKQNIIDNLVNRLKPLALNQTADTEEYKTALKTEIVDILEGLPIKYDGDKKTYLNNIADKLATQLHTIPAKDVSKSTDDSLEDEFQKQIWEWLKDVPEFSSASALSVEENQKLVKSLANKLKKLQAQEIENSTVQEKMQNEINEWLETNAGKNLDSKTKNELAETLLQRLINATKSVNKVKGKTPLSGDNITKQIWDWLNDIPELAGGTQLENQEMVEKLAKKLFELCSQGKADSNLEDEILDWLTTSFESKGERLDVKKQSDLVNTLLNKLKTLSDVKEDEQLVQDIFDCLGDIPSLDLTSEKSKKMIEQLANKIQEWQSQKQGDFNKEDMKVEISNWLDNLNKNAGAQINTKTRNQLMQKLMNVASSAPKQRKRWNKQDNLHQEIFDGISNILEGSCPNLSNGNKNNLQNKISNLLSRNIDSIKSGDVNDDIKMKLVDFLEQEGQMSPQKAMKVTDDIIKKVQSMAFPESSITVHSDHLKDSVKEEVAHILDESNIHCDNRDEIESILTDILADQVMRGENQTQTKDRLISALRDSDIPKEQTEEIATKLIQIGKEVSLSQRTRDSTIRLGGMSKSREFEALSPMRKESFQNSVEQEIVDYIQEIVGNSSVLSIKKYEEAAKKLAQRISDKMCEKDTSISDKRKDIESEISKCFRSLSISTDGSQVSELADKFQNLAFKASTPKRLSLDQGFSFRPQRDSRGSTISAIEDVSQLKMQAPTPSKEEEQFMNKLVNKIDSWMSDLPIDLDTEDGKGFKQVMIRDLAGDIIDRQKYLQLNPEAKTSDEEELEHLKYQVFRWLNKLPNVKELIPSISKTDYLMERIKAVPVPQLIKTPDRSYKQRDSNIQHMSQGLSSTPDRSYKQRDSNIHLSQDLSSTPDRSYKQRDSNIQHLSQGLSSTPDRSYKKRDSNIQHLSQGLSSLENEIFKWFEAVPTKFYATTDKDWHQQMVKDLAQLIDQLHREGALTNTLFDDVVTEWLQKMLKEYNENYFSSLSEGLKGELLNIGLISLEETSMLTRQSSHQIQEYLRSHILDWLKEKPLYQRRHSMDKREQEQIVAELSEILKNMLKASHPSETHIDDRVLDAIKSHLKKLPMESHLKLDDEFHHSTASDLLENLKMSKMFRSFSELQSQPQLQTEAEAEHVLPILKEWTDSLPLQVRKTSVDNKKLDDLKEEFAKTLHQIKQQHPAPNKSASEVLKGEINNFFHKFPIEPTKKNDQKFVSDKIDELHNKLLELQSQLSTSNKPSVSGGGHKQVILNWAKKLPFQPGKSIEKSKSEINEISSKIEDVLSNVPAYGFENVTANLEKEIKSFLNKLPLQKNKIKGDYIKELINELNDFVKTSSVVQPTMATDSSFSSKSGFKKAADVLYDNMNEWCENLPIHNGNTPEEKEKVRTLKQNIASKLINIIGDLNVNPEIFYDDSLYEDLLNDEIDNLLSTLPPSQELENNLPAHKENLIRKIKKAKNKTQDELAGQAYKQQLREVILKTMPPVEDLSIEELAPFEVLKDNVADAYINLHYAAGNEEMKKQLKNKISDEINQFCNDYLQRYPDSPVDPRKLNRELYNVLQKIPAPKDETMKSQVEQVRIKDEINDWLKAIPLKEDQSPADQLQRNKIVTVLAKRLHDIEKDKEYNPDIDIEELMQKEIKKLILKLPIQKGQEGKIQEMVEQLTSKLKSTEESRRFYASNIRHSIDTADDVLPCETVSTFNSKFNRPADQPAHSKYNSYLSQYAPPFPPSTLSTEDRAHLEKIRERNQQKQLSFKSDFSPYQSKDASVNPIPIDAGSQTDVGPGAGPGSAKSTQSQISPPCQGSSSQAPVSPQVFVKEHFWDSPETTMRDPGYAAPFCQQGQSASFQDQNQSYRQQPQPSPQFSWPQSQQVNLTPRYGQSKFPSPDQIRTPQAPGMMSPPAMTQQPYMPQQPRQSQSPCMSATPQMPSQAQQPYSGPQGTYPSPDQIRTPQAPDMTSSPAMTQPPYMPQQPRQSQSPSVSATPQMPSQAPFMSHPQTRSPQSPCMSQASGTQPLYPSAPPYTIESQSPSMPPPSPCMMPKPPPQMRPWYMNQPQIPESRSPYMSRYDRTPSLITPQESQPQMPSSQSQETPHQQTQSSRHIPPCYSNQRRESRKPFRQPCFGSPDLSSTSSPFDTGPDADIGRYGPKVTRLGSFDDVPCTKSCGSQSPRAKRSAGAPEENYDWTIRFPAEDGFWGTPCPRRRVHRSPNRSSERGFIKEKERKEETLRCRCRERTMTKCMGRRPQHSCQLDDDSMNHCAKCCGAHCPHPSYLFFK